jgi:uncharacterized membrane protein YphA (DoxX/SURF4 family)
MNDSMAQPRAELASLELSGWKTFLNWMAAVLVGLLFLLSGIWKITDVHGAAIRMTQAKVPEALSIAAALGFGIAETVAGVLVTVPRFRRWGAFLASAMLVAFMVFVGINYNALMGEDCSCFPWIKRAVGPAFFIGDTAMLGLAVLAWVWARRSSAWRSALLVCGAVAVFGFVSYGVELARTSGTRAPATITVANEEYSLEHGRVFLYFFNPGCDHCMSAAKRMSHLNWGATRIVAVPVDLPQYADGFLVESGLKAVVTKDFERLKDVFHYKAYPFAVALENGRQTAALTRFEGNEPTATLKRLRLVD